MRPVLLLVAATVLAGCASGIDCDCPGPVGLITFEGTVASVERGDGDGASGNDRVLFDVAEWRITDPSLGSPGQMVVQYDGTAHYLTDGDRVLVEAGNFVDEGWVSAIEPRGTCSCAPETTSLDGDPIDTGLVTTVWAVLAWWQIALAVVAGVVLTLARRWVWRWRHLTSDGVRAAVLSAVTMVGGILLGLGVIGLLTYDRSRNGAEPSFWAVTGIGMAVLGLSLLRRAKPAPSD